MIAETIETPAVAEPRKKPRRPCNRPRVHPVAKDRNPTRPEKVTVRLSPDEYRCIRRCADHAGVTMAEFLRNNALQRWVELRDARHAGFTSPADALESQTMAEGLANNGRGLTQE